MKAFATGEVITLTEVNDGVFSAGIMGDGFAILPENNVIYSPVNGTITVMMQESRHACGLQLENGAEILLHVGLDTVAMNGDGFEYLVKEGQKVSVGTPLIKFDKEKIKAAGYVDTTVCVITEPGKMENVKFVTGVHAVAKETTVATAEQRKMMTDFRKSTVYQIYPRSFYDTDGDGFGDLKGVTAKLDYIKELGVDYIWMTPFFVSPQYDNGYDVEDYYNIDPRYGTMEDFEELSREAEKRGIKLMLDMVFNHTSSNHEWFQKALAGDEKYKNFYIFKKGKADGSAPTNWESKFGGNAWEYVPEMDEYYLHLFHVKQPDLNWDNPEVREEVKKIVRFWMEKGVKGFRFDVVNLISKDKYEDDFEGDGRRFYTDGPNIHKYLKELNEGSFGQDAEIITVGEMSSTSMENCFGYAGEDSNELSMVFSFHHLKVDFMGNEKWVLVPTDFMKLKKIIFEWQTGMAENNAWNAVFWCNHDQPRPVSRFGDEGKYWRKSAKMLATIIHGLRGTPYIYQGEEIGMTNTDFTRIDQFKDVESLNHYEILQQKGLSKEDALRIIQIHSRDNGRTPMQWNGENHGGFTTGTPWIGVNENYSKVNVQSQIHDETSIFNYYKTLVATRKEYDIIAYGDIKPVDAKHPSVFAYERTYGDEKLLVVCNFYKNEVEWNSLRELDGYEVILGNYQDQMIKDEKITLRPYEAMMLYKKSQSYSKSGAVQMLNLNCTVFFKIENYDFK